MTPTVLLAACLAGQPTFHVSPAGNDAWSGTLPAPNAGRTDGPFATPARARDAVRQLRAAGKLTRPVTVLLRGGRYELSEPLTFTPADSGTADSPTRFAAHPGEKPVLSGGVCLSSWKAGKGGVHTAALPGKQAWPIRHLSVNGQMRHRPRLPAEGVYPIAGLAGADPKAKYNTPGNKFEFAPGQVRAGWKNLKDVEAVVLHFWVDTHFRIAAVDEKTRIVTLDRSSRRRLTETHGPTPARYYLSNVFEALSRPGQFYLDSPTRTIHYIPEKGEDLAKAEVVAPRLDAVLVLAGKPAAGQYVEHLRFEGLTFSDTAWEPPAKDAADAQAASIVPGSVRLSGARHCALLGCTFVNLGGYGVELSDGCRHNRLVGNELTRLGAGGIRVSGGAHGSPEGRRTGANVITDNHLHDLGRHFHSGIGILVQHADGNTIAHNHIHHLYYTGISVGWVWGYAPSVSRGNKVEYNRIHHVGRGLLSDMGGIYLLGSSPDTVVRGNVIHDVDSFNYGGWGIYTDEGSSHIVIEDNLVYRTKSGGFHQHYGRENVVRNNIFALARTEQMARTRMEKHKSFTFERNIVYYRQGRLMGGRWTDDQFALDRNLYFHAGAQPVVFPAGSLAQWQARGFDKHSLIADPLFKDPDRGDFTLAANSPARKLGFRPFDAGKAGPRKVAPGSEDSTRGGRRSPNSARNVGDFALTAAPSVGISPPPGRRGASGDRGDGMRRLLWAATVAVALAGCASGPLLENPLLLRVDKPCGHENPIYIPQGPMAYARVWEKVYDILSDYFDIAYSNRYDGRIETAPKIAPGIEQPWKPGSPDLYQRMLAFCQTIRHRAIVVISAANDGGYFIDVKVFKELEDLPTPTRPTASEATFRLESTVQRQYEVVELGAFESGWIPIGRDVKLEQVILERLSCLDARGPCR